MPTTLGRLSRVLNRVMGGEPGQTLCARIAARNTNCLFCRLMSWAIEPNHCLLELAKWHRRGTGAAERLGEHRARSATE